MICERMVQKAAAFMKVLSENEPNFASEIILNKMMALCPFFKMFMLGFEDDFSRVIVKIYNPLRAGKPTVLTVRMIARSF